MMAKIKSAFGIMLSLVLVLSGSMLYLPKGSGTVKADTITEVTSIKDIHSAGNYKLTADCTVEDEWNPPSGDSTTNIDLNGKTLTISGSNGIIRFPGNNTTLTFKNGTILMKGNHAQSNGKFHMKGQNCTLSFGDGLVIKGDTSSTNESFFPFKMYGRNNIIFNSGSKIEDISVEGKNIFWIDENGNHDGGKLTIDSGSEISRVVSDTMIRNYYGTVIIKGKINNCKGAIVANLAGLVNLTGAKITNNSGPAFFMNITASANTVVSGNTEITDNEVNTEIFSNEGKITFSDSLIARNVATNNGFESVMINTEPTAVIYMQSGEIKDNVCDFWMGAPIKLLGGKFYMNGGEISGNTGVLSGAVYVPDDDSYADTEFHVSGNATIKNNKMDDGEGNVKNCNVHLINRNKYNERKHIFVDSALTGSIGVTAGLEVTSENSVRFTEPSDAAAASIANFVSDNDAYAIKVDSNALHFILKPESNNTTVDSGEGGSTATAEAGTKYNEVPVENGVVKDITGTKEASGEKNTMGAKIANSNELASLLSLTDDEKALGVNVWLDIQDYSAKIPAADKEVIQKAIGDYAIGMYLDVNLFKKVAGKDAIKVSSTNGKVRVSFVIPEKLRKDGRTFEIIRLHDGKTDVIQGTYDEKTHVFTFETDKFSTYAIAYNENKSPKTIDAPFNNVWELIFMMSLAGLAGMMLTKKYER